MATMSWDDGKHTKVKHIKLTFDDVINSIQVEYEGTSLNSEPHGTIGAKSDEFTLSSDEYLTEVNGYYKTLFSGDVITGLTFITNKKTYGPYGHKTRNYVSINAPKGSHIIGFSGTSGSALNSIDGYLAHTPPVGSTATTPEHTGAIHEDVETSGEPTKTEGPPLVETTPGDFDTSLGGPGTIPKGPESTPPANFRRPGSGTSHGIYPSGAATNPGGSVVNAETNPIRPGSTPGNFRRPGTTHGGSGTNPQDVGTIDEETITSPGGNGSNIDSNLQKLEVQGGKGDYQWDDGTNHDGVTKIYIGRGTLGIEQIKFDYVKNGETKEGPYHGVKGKRSSTSTVEINHPNEYLVSVKGWYDSTNIIQGIQFITNKKTSDSIGYDFTEDDKEFSLGAKDKKIIGFHGFTDSHLNSLGAYVAPITN